MPALPWKRTEDVAADTEVPELLGRPEVYSQLEKWLR